MAGQNGERHQVSDDRNKAPELLADLARHVSAILQEMTGMGQEQAEDIGYEAATRMAEDWGGCNFYFPKGVAMQYYKRYLRIYNDFNGHNHHDLVKKHRLSLQRIYKIINIVRAEETRRRQGDMFG